MHILCFVTILDMPVLFTQEADVGVASFTITAERESVIDFTMPFFEDASSILVSYEEDVFSVLKIFQPFSTLVWFSVAIMLAFTGGLLYLTKRYTLDTSDTWGRHAFAPSLRRIANTSFELFAAFMEQGQSLPSGHCAFGLFCYSVVIWHCLTKNEIRDHRVSPHSKGGDILLSHYHKKCK